MADAFSLRGVMSLDTTAFKAGLNAAQGSLSKFTAGSQKAFKDAAGLAKNFGSSLASSGKAIAAQTAMLTALGGAFVYASSKAFAAADAIGDLAAQTGSSVEEIQKLGYAAKAVGADSEEFGKALVKIAKGASAAKEGNDAATASFAKLGISAQDLAGKRADQIFYMIADGAKNTHDPIARTTALAEILGKGATNLAMEMANGSEVFREYGAEAEKTGIILSASLIAGAQEANDKLNAMKSTLEAGLVKVMAQLAPYFTVAADRLREFISESGLLSTGVAPAIRKVADFIGVLADGIRGLNIIWALAKTAGLGFAYAVNQAVTGVVIAVGRLAQAINGGMLAAFNKIASIASKVGIEFDFVNSQVADLNKTIADNERFVADLAATTAGLGEQYNTAAEAAHNLAMQDMPSAAIDKAIDDAEKLKVAYEKAAVARGDGIADPREIAGVSVEKEKKEKEKKVKADKLIPNEALEQAKRDLEEFSTSIHSTLSGSISAAFEGDFKSVGDMWKSMLKQMVADSMAADLMSAIGLGSSAMGGKTTGQSFFAGAAGFFGMGGGVTEAAMMGGGRDQGGGMGGGVTQLFNITTKDASSFQTARGRIASDSARAVNNGG